MGQKTHSRKFLGKTEGFDNKEEQRKEQKHLKAYLKGYSQYAFGKDAKGYTIYHPVKQSLIPLNK